VETLEPAQPASPAPPRPAGLHQRRNVVFLLLDIAVFFFALSFVDMSSVLPSFLSHLTRQPVLIGILGSLQTGCWLLPQMFIAPVVAARRRKLPIVLLATSLSRLSWLPLLLALFLLPPENASLILIVCFVSVGTFWFLDGLASPAWYDLIAHAIPPTLRGRLFGAMSLIGGLFAVVGGLAVQRILGNPAFPFPTDYRLMLGITLVCFVAGIIPLARIEEDPGEPAPPVEPMAAYFRRLPGLLRERVDFRRLVGVQLLVGAAGLAIPFYAPFGVLGLGLPEASVGTFVVGVTLGQMVGGMAWGYLGDHGRKELAVRVLAGITMVAPLLALALRVFAPTLPGGEVAAILAAAFFFVGCSNRSGWVGFSNYVLDIAHPRERPVLIGLMNTLSGVLAIVPPLGGLLVTWLGYEATFAVAILPGAAGLLLSLRLRHVRV
jgi:MFS family permease